MKYSYIEDLSVKYSEELRDKKWGEQKEAYVDFVDVAFAYEAGYRKALRDLAED